MNKRTQIYLFLPFAALILSSCSVMMGPNKKNGSSASHTVQDTGSNTGGGDLIGGGANTGAGNGANVAGVGSLTAPTADAVIARLKNGLENNVSPSAGNFARTLAQVQGNLPKVTDPLKVTGFDQVELLAYGACSDLTTGNTPLMQTRYNVTKAGTIAAQSAALVAAGVKMLDAHLAGLASNSSGAAGVKTALEALVAKVGAVQGNTSTIAFMSVCIAANTAGSSLMGF